MKRPLVVAGLGLLVLASAACHRVVIYRSLSEPGAFKTCDANLRFHTETSGSDAANAKKNNDHKIASMVEEKGGCGAFIMNEGFDRKNLVQSADFQLCHCK